MAETKEQLEARLTAELAELKEVNSKLIADGDALNAKYQALLAGKSGPGQLEFDGSDWRDVRKLSDSICRVQASYIGSPGRHTVMVRVMDADDKLISVGQFDGIKCRESQDGSVALLAAN